MVLDVVAGQPRVVQWVEGEGDDAQSVVASLLYRASIYIGPYIKEFFNKFLSRQR